MMTRNKLVDYLYIEDTFSNERVTYIIVSKNLSFYAKSQKFLCVLLLRRYPPLAFLCTATQVHLLFSIAYSAVSSPMNDKPLLDLRNEKLQIRLNKISIFMYSGHELLKKIRNKILETTRASLRFFLVLCLRDSHL